MGLKKISISFFVAIVFVAVTLFIPAVRNLLNSAALPILSLTRSLITKPSSSISLSEENSVLKSQLTTLIQENHRLETELGLRSLDDKKVPVRLLVAGSHIYGSAFLDVKGVSVQNGDYVYAQGNVVAGNLELVDNNQGRINFLGSHDRFLAEIVSTGEILELSGNGIGYYQGNIPHSDSIAVGETIALKGYPQSIVGTITAVEDNGTSISTIWVRSPVNLFNKSIFYVNQN